jgi:hypothetical protein
MDDPKDKHSARTKSTLRMAARRTRAAQAHLDASASCLAEAAVELSGERGQRLANLARGTSLFSEKLNGIVADLLRPRGGLR